MSYRKLFLASALALMLIVTGHVLGQSTIPVWGQPQFLGQGWFPSMVVDVTGRVHIVWNGTTGPEDKAGVLWYTSGNIDDAQVAAPVDIMFLETGGTTMRSSLGVTSDGVLYMMFRRFDHELAYAPADRAASAQAWTLVDNFSSAGYYTALLVDHNDIIHAISSQQNINLKLWDLTAESSLDTIRAQYPCASCSDLLYLRSDDHGKSWDPAVNLSRTIEGSERQEIYEDKNGRLYVSWSEGSDWYVGAGTEQDVRIIYSDDTGLTWSDPIILTGKDNRPISQIALTETKDAGMLVVWRYADSDLDRQIYFQISNDSGVSWTEPAAIPGVRAESLGDSILDRYQLVTDLAGTIHLLAVGIDDTFSGEETPSLLHLEYRQDRWFPPDIVYSDSDNRPEWPAAAIGPRNELHVAWFVRNSDGTFVYYAKRSATMPDQPVLAAFVPTTTPLPTATDVPVFEATITPIPTVAPIDASVTIHRNQDLNAIEVLLGGIFAAGLLCIGVLIIFGFRPRL